MKVSKKQIQKWREQEAKKSAGHYANNLETEAERLLRAKQEEAMAKIRNNPDLLRAMKRLKDR